MTGVEILATQEVAINWSFNWLAFLITAGVIIGFFASVFCSIDGLRGLWQGLITGMILGIAFGSIMGTGLKTPTEYETRYKVTISDEVQMNDFLERYEIVSQEGKIYTVRERNE